jgi:hypothetical protein
VSAFGHVGDASIGSLEIRIVLGTLNCV